MKAWLFAPLSPRPLAVMRILLGCVFLYDAGVRWPYVIELYSSAGLPMPAFPEWQYPGHSFVPPIPGPTAAVVLHSLLLFALVAVVLGWQTRFSLCLSLVLSMWLGLLDHAGTFKKYSVIGAHVMLLLSFTRCGARWSIDGLLFRRRDEVSLLSARWPVRLLQLLVVNIYLQAAILKLRLPDFLDGELLMFSLLDDLWGGDDRTAWLTTRPVWLIGASWATVVIELLIPLMLCIPRTRRTGMCLGIAFHLTLAAVLHLGIFSFAMIALLMVFLEEGDLQLLSRWRRRCTAPFLPLFSAPQETPSPANDRQSRLRLLRSEIRRAIAIRPWLGYSLYGTLAALSVGADVAVQRAEDFYGVYGRRAFRGWGWESNDQQLWNDKIRRTILTPQPVDPRDYVHRLDLGSRLSHSGTWALGESETVHHGRIVYAAARLIRNHPALDLTWQLVRPDGEFFEQSHEIAPDVTHATIGFELTEDLPPGTYEVVLKVDGVPAMRKTFELRDRTSTR